MFGWSDSYLLDLMGMRHYRSARHCAGYIMLAFCQETAELKDPTGYKRSSPPQRPAKLPDLKSHSLSMACQTTRSQVTLTELLVFRTVHLQEADQSSDQFAQLVVLYT